MKSKRRKTSSRSPDAHVGRSSNRPRPRAVGSAASALLPGPKNADEGGTPGGVILPGKAPFVPAQVAAKIDVAVYAKRWMVAVFRVENNQLHLDRFANDFPIGDVDTALRLLVEDLKELK